MAPDARRFLSRSAEATLAFGAVLGAALRAHGRRGVVLALDGELGAGKTTLVRGLAEGLGVEGAVASPTFALMREHEGGGRRLLHLDAWRTGPESAFLAEGGAALLGGADVAAVEWAERVVDELPESRLELVLAHRSPEERSLTLVARGSDAALAALVAALEPPAGLEELPADANSGPGAVNR